MFPLSFTGVVIYVDVSSSSFFVFHSTNPNIILFLLNLIFFLCLSSICFRLRLDLILFYFLFFSYVCLHV